MKNYIQKTLKEFDNFNIQWEKKGFLSMSELKSFISSALTEYQNEIIKKIRDKYTYRTNEGILIVQTNLDELIREIKNI